MKTHLRLINRNGIGAQFKVACGSKASWTKNTSSDRSKVDCKRCKEAMRKGGGK